LHCSFWQVSSDCTTPSSLLACRHLRHTKMSLPLRWNSRKFSGASLHAQHLLCEESRAQTGQEQGNGQSNRARFTLAAEPKSELPQAAAVRPASQASLIFLAFRRRRRTLLCCITPPPHPTPPHSEARKRGEREESEREESENKPHAPPWLRRAPPHQAHAPPPRCPTTRERRRSEATNKIRLRSSVKREERSEFQATCNSSRPLRRAFFVCKKKGSRPRSNPVFWSGLTRPAHELAVTSWQGCFTAQPTRRPPATTNLVWV
jgi:hypothetical protein